MSAQVVVDRTACMGTGVCVSLAPDHFDVVDGLSTPLDAPEPMPEELVEEVVDNCPMAALSPAPRPHSL
jgi:ferredoxin